MAFGLNFFTLAPGLRVAGDSLAYAYKFTKKGGQGDGKEGLEVGLTDDPTIKLLESAVSGYEQVSDRDAVYTTLVSGGLTEIVPGFALGIDSLSSIEITTSAIKFAVAGAQPLLQFRSNNVPAVTKVGDSGYTWDLPPATFATLKTTAETYQSDLKTKVEAMIAERIAADDTLTAAVAAQGASDAAALAAEVVRVNDLIATGMWLFADQAAFPAAADNHGRIVHSHADASMFYAHAGAWHKIENEAEATAARLVIQNDVDANETASDAAEAALSGRLDVLEADPTTATAVAAGDAATLSSATTYTDTAITNVIGTAPGVLDTLGEIADAINDDANAYTTLATSIAAVQTDVDGNESDGDVADAALSGRLDTLEADPTTAAAVAAVQADVDANETASDAAEAALSGRLDTLEADPTTATAVAAVQSDVDQNESDGDAAIAGEATTRANADTALSGRLDVLEADPTTATAVAAVQADVNQNETDGDAAIAAEATTRGNADTALSGRLDTLEADPTTATAVAAVQADVDSIEAAAATARTTLQTALQNAIDAVQADVNTNESDADTALALKAALTGAVFSGDLTLKKSDGSAVALRLSRTDNPDMNTEWKVQPSYVDINKECLSVMAGSDVVASFDERQRVAINTTDPDHNLDVGGDGKFSTNLTVGAALNLSGGLTDAANDSAAAGAGVAVNQLYRNGSVVMIRVS